MGLDMIRPSPSVLSEDVTPEMVEAGARAFKAHRGIFPDTELYVAIYTAMRSAALRGTNGA